MPIAFAFERDLRQVADYIRGTRDGLPEGFGEMILGHVSRLWGFDMLRDSQFTLPHAGRAHGPVSQVARFAHPVGRHSPRVGKVLIILPPVH